MCVDSCLNQESTEADRLLGGGFLEIGVKNTTTCWCGRGTCGVGSKKSGAEAGPESSVSIVEVLEGF